MTQPVFPCANLEGREGGCQMASQIACESCFLVQYCSETCRNEHRRWHKAYCESDLISPSWLPSWQKERRVPDFAVTGPTKPPGYNYWSNVPAIDVLNLKYNENRMRDGRTLRILFAASGDLNNIIKTISSLTVMTQHSFRVALNDSHPGFAARNLILLLIALMVEDQKEAIDCIIHVWYSAAIRKSHKLILDTKIRPLVQSVCYRIRNQPAKHLHSELWTANSCSIEVSLTKECWMVVLLYLEIPLDFTPEQARKNRALVTLAPRRRDYHCGKYSLQQPAHRVCGERFRHDGILLPFGHSREPFQIPNPTLFRNNLAWTLPDVADPLKGWETAEVANTSSGSATMDLYGKLYYYLIELFSSFLIQIRTGKISFELMSFDLTKLVDFHEKRIYENRRYDRIDASNLSNRFYRNRWYETIDSLKKLLMIKKYNHFATILMFFHDATEREILPRERMEDLRLNTRRILQYLPCPPRPDGQPSYTVSNVKLSVAARLIRNEEKYFQRFVANRDWILAATSSFPPLVMKERHTIVDKWPLKLKKEPEEAGACEEFDMRLESGRTGRERYVEWVRGYISTSS